MSERTLNNSLYKVVIVGSGPAGVSVAWPLVRAGIDVLMLDFGNKPPRSGLDFIDYNPEQIENEEKQTPKVLASNLAYVFRDFQNRNNVQSVRFSGNGSLALGGLSNVWSALAPVFTDRDLKDFPFSKSELLPFYEQTAKRIGISGPDSGDLYDWLGGAHLSLQENLKLHPLSEHLFTQYNKKKAKVNQNGISFGLHNQAILTKQLGKRKPFSQEDSNHFTYYSEAIYNSAVEIPEILQYNNFSLKAGHFVTSIQNEGGIFTIDTTDRQNNFHAFRAKKVILAAGTIGSTRIFFRSLKQYGTPLPLLTTRLSSFVIVAPKCVLKTQQPFGFSFWNLSYYLTLGDLKEIDVYGHMMPTEGIPHTELIKRLPFTVPASSVLSEYFWPTMMLGTCVFPSDFSNNQISLEKSPEGDRLVLTGGETSNYRHYAKKAKRKLALSFRAMGFVLLKNSWNFTDPGSDFHYAGTLPMSRIPKPFHTNSDGESYDIDGLYIVDGAILPYLPAKSHTLTIMANANRIGTKLSSQIN